MATSDLLVEPSIPDGRSRALAAAAVGSFWILPFLGPILVRLFMTGRPFAMHYFRYALIVQGVFVLGFAVGGLETLVTGRTEWTSLVVVPAWLWAFYGSVVGLVAALSGERRPLKPIPRSWLWAPSER